MKMHTQEYKDMMSERKRQWWIRVRKDPKRLKKVLKKMSINNARNFLGKRGELSAKWKGGKFTSKRDGYVYLYSPTHPRAIRNGSRVGGHVLEHRLVMEKMLGRYLLEDEEVHHKNSIKHDNRPENLMLVSHIAHFQEHGCPQCGFKLFTK